MGKMRLGHGDTEDVNDGFKLVESLKEIPGKQISCGAFSAVLSKGGSLFTFGDGHGGELGNGALLDVNIPLRIHEPEEEAGKPCHYSFISCGSEHGYRLYHLERQLVLLLIMPILHI